MAITLTPDTVNPRKGWTSWLLLMAAIQLLILWVAGHTEGGLPGLAKRYYQAARLFAPAHQVALLDEAESAWIGKVPYDKQAPLRHDLHDVVAEPLPQTVIRVLCAAWPGDRPPYSFSIPVKLASLILFLAGLGWLMLIAANHPLDGVLMAGCLLMAALGLAVPLLAPAAESGHGFLADNPSAPAVLPVLAAFICFARGRGALAGISLAMALVWHTGFAAAVLPCALGAFGVTLCDYAGSRHIRVMIATLTVVLGCLLVHLRPGPYLQYPVWIPATLVIAFLLAAPDATQTPVWRATASLSAFLFLLLCLETFSGLDGAQQLLARVTGHPLPGIPALLSGIRHLASLSLVLALIIGLGNRLLPVRTSAGLRRTLLLSAASGALLAGVAAGATHWPGAGRKTALLLHAEEGLHARPVLSRATLPLLDPRKETSFYTALGDFLLAPPP